MKGFRYVATRVLVEFRCAGCDVRSAWAFPIGLNRYLDQYCPGCSSLLWCLYSGYNADPPSVGSGYEALAKFFRQGSLVV